MSTQQLEKIWNEWKIEELIGEGASGKVYKAKRCDMEDTYSAIKIIEIPQNDSEIREALAEGMSEEEVRNYFKGFVDDLVEEITLLESLKDAKGIVSISDYKVVEKENSVGWIIYIRMELLKGINDYSMEKPFTEEDIINLGLDLSQALEYCEKMHIIHRDIKPENIFISKFGEFKLGDFGIARKLENTSSIMSKKGTYLYMPPEVYKGEEYDKTVDLYSLGIVMYKLGNKNRTPFLPKAPEPITFRDKEKALMMRMQGEEIPKPESMSDDLYKIIKKMISYNPKDRYQSAKELREDLEKIKEKNSKEFTGTINIFSHVNLKKNEDNRQEITETKLETEEQIADVNNDVKDDFAENEEIKQKVEQNENENQNEEIKQDEQKIDKTEVIEQEKPEVNEKKQNSIKKKSKKIIIIILSILLIISIIFVSTFILVNRNQNEEIIKNTIIMPNLINLTREEAEKELEGKNLQVIYQDTYQEGAEKGRIVYQSIAPDMEVDNGSKLVLFINNIEKDEIKKVTMPKVIGMNIQQATDQLLKLGLMVERIDEINETIEKDIVFEQDIPEKTEILQGSNVMLKVSKGKEEQEKTEENQNEGNQKDENSEDSENPTKSEEPAKTGTATNISNENNNVTTNNNNNWSNWLESLPQGINESNSIIETKTQYSYRTKQTTTSTKTSLTGWTQNGVASTSYSEWGKYYRTEEKPKESDTLRIVSTDPYTATEYTYSHWEMSVELPNGQRTLKYDIKKLESCDEYKVLSATKHTITSEEEFGNFPEGYFYAPEGSKDGDKCPRCGAWFWKYESKRTVNKYSYLFQERDVIKVYNYYKWGDWSSYGDTAITENDSREVRTRKLYRYKSK